MTTAQADRYGPACAERIFDEMEGEQMKKMTGTLVLAVVLLAGFVGTASLRDPIWPDAITYNVN